MKDEREIQEEIDRIFEEAGLSQDDRNLWSGRLAEAGEYVRRAFIESFGEEYDLLRFFTGDLRNRIEAGRDRQKFERILTEEKSYFTGVLRHHSED
ncbi:MAG: hypothetical protein HGA31_05115 [Candidatus Moranbacteria bacterium]|nr:hypothetical protein [Candidatus Moranbacteria bacterium]